MGRDILSLKNFGREEFIRIFDVADELLPFARDRRNTDLLMDKTLVTAFYQPSTLKPSAHDSDASPGGWLGFSDVKNTRAEIFTRNRLKIPYGC
jgi:aspartate carbamoyltransferase catalytic subunit